MSVRDEILEQPEVAARILRTQREPVRDVVRSLHRRRIESVVIAARGTSDHAALYAQYLLGVRAGLPVALASPSILSLYGAALRFHHTLVVGISQSGRSPDVVEVLRAARRQRIRTIAITNAPGSPLHRIATYGIDVSAGKERAIAATKTYTAELLAVALLAAALGPEADGELDAELDRALDAVPDAMAAALAFEPEARAAAEALAGMRHCVVLGRGFGHPTAREWGLKLKELTRVLADPYSAADFEHGPRTVLEPGFPVLAVATSGATQAGVLDLVGRLGREQGAETLVLSDSAEARSAGRWSIPVPTGVPEWLSPIVEIVPAQLFAYHLALARGIDPDAPRWLNKVTETR